MKKNTKYILFTLFIMSIMTNVRADDSCYVCGKDIIPIPMAIPNFVSNLITLAQILVPVILVITGMIKYAKVIISGEEKESKEVNRSFIRSLISAFAVFLIVSIVKFTFGIIDKANTSDNTISTSCIDCFINGKCGEPQECLERNEDIQEYKEKILNTAKKGCSSYSLKKCPSEAADGTPCTKKGMNKGDSAPSCKKACSILGNNACKNRKDCKVVENKCTEK